ncbi:MAG: cysteine--tRNA ligase [Pelagibacterales bacterium]|nr:cysteine--tRNA ligase [Pelagibacterales bacterium]|tara:strand:- start:1950 stop:3338 length:1389 start_codon:yes stop_codon:yes gene_type:complete
MFSLKLHNTLGNIKEEFIPINKKHIKIYACGPTVYNYAHIGNARMAVVCDLLVRILKTLYPKVTYVSNITDIDDKIINASLEKKIPIEKLTKKFEKIYNEDMSALGVSKPDIQPRATEHINEMIHLIETLIKNNSAYVKDYHVLFDVLSYPQYGQLSGRIKEEQVAGSRIEVASYKKNPGDFVLWKPSTENQPGWESPWGRGRPGWHIECSAMSEKTLSLPFDIHGGGLDLTFPHHENEIAQTCGAHKFENPKEYARYWVHNGFVTIDGEKMSKSIGNIFLVHDLINTFPGETLRYALLSSHYRQPLNWNNALIKQSQKTLDRIYRILKENEKIKYDQNIPFDDNVLEALTDDLNSVKALSEINKLAEKLSKSEKTEKILYKSKLLSSGRLIGILKNKPNIWLNYNTTNDNINMNEINKLIEKRDEARNKKDFTTADEIRNILYNMNIEIEDTKDGTKWRKK